LTPRQRIQITLARGIPDRVPMLDITFWPDTLSRWRQEGFPEGADPADYFGFTARESSSSATSART